MGTMGDQTKRVLAVSLALAGYFAGLPVVDWHSMQMYAGAFLITVPAYFNSTDYLNFIRKKGS